MPWQRVLFLIISLAVIYWVLYGEPGYKRSARKFKAFVEANQPRLAEIEKWAATCKVEDQGRFVGVTPADWPEALRGLKYGNWDPAYFKIRPKPRAAFIVYGGALGHWGLVMDLERSGKLDEFGGDFLLRVNERDAIWFELGDGGIP